MLSEAIAKMRRKFDEFTGSGLQMAGPAVEEHVRALRDWEEEVRRLELMAEGFVPELGFRPATTSFRFPAPASEHRIGRKADV